MTHPDFRALCAELLAEVEALNDVIGQEGQADLALIPRARAALAAPEQGAPSDEDLCDLAAPYWDWDGERTFFGSTAFARAVLARYGAQAVPVAVAERLPGEGDYHPDNDWCWGWYSWRWRMMDSTCFHQGGEANHWLPHWALPLPEAQP